LAGGGGGGIGGGGGRRSRPTGGAGGGSKSGGATTARSIVSPADDDDDDDDDDGGGHGATDGDATSPGNGDRRDGLSSLAPWLRADSPKSNWSIGPSGVRDPGDRARSPPANTRVAAPGGTARWAASGKSALWESASERSSPTGGVLGEVETAAVTTATLERSAVTDDRDSRWRYP
jgi:hypothetical protein